MTREKSSSTIARRLASQTWGEVQGQKKVSDGIWSFYTAGHGGYVVDTDICKELSEYKDTVYIRANSNQYYPSEQHFAAFEEDCDYAKVVWMYPFIIEKEMKDYNIPDGVTKEEWVNQRLDLVKRSLLQWNPDFLKKHPKPGPMKKPVAKTSRGKRKPTAIENLQHSFVQIGYEDNPYYNYPKGATKLDYKEIEKMHLLSNTKEFKIWLFEVKPLSSAVVKRVAEKLYSINPLEYNLLLFKDSLDRVLVCHHAKQTSGEVETFIAPVFEAAQKGVFKKIALTGKEGIEDDLDIMLLHREAFELI